jgi:predicted permease
VLPGVEAASIAITVPPDRIAFTDGYEIEGRSLPPGSEQPAVPVPFASLDYLRTLGIPVIRGRWFDSRDTADAPRVTVISESMARRHFPGEDAVGKRLKHGGKAIANPYMEIVGVVGDVKYEGLENADSAVYYEACAQSPARPMWLMVRTGGDAHGMASAVRQTLRGIDPAVPLDRVTTLAEAMAESVSVPRFRSVTMSAFAVTALLLAAVGIYSVIAYFVSRRTQEIGLRMALGATPSRVLRLVIGQSGRLAAIGVAVGVVAAFGLTRVLKEMLFGVTVSDTLTFAAAVLVLGAIAVGASLAPALRAARLDPANALRHE